MGNVRRGALFVLCTARALSLEMDLIRTRGARVRSGSRALVAVVATALLAAAACAPPVTTSPPPGATGPSPGCGATTRGATTEEDGRIRVSNSTRRYRLTVPSAHEPGTSDPVPLVFDFHGLLEGWAGTHPFATQFSALAERHGFAVVYPVGQGDGVYWDVSPDESNRDLRFVDELLAHLESELCIDRSRVYVTGLSYGAFMTSMLMCMRAETFAAAAPVAGISNLCTATERAVPFVTFHGTEDNILPYPFFADTPRAIAAKYGCGATPTVSILDPDPRTRAPITRTTWDCSAAGSAAESYVIERGGHSWPGSEFFSAIRPIVGRTASSLDASAVIWEFFEGHRLDA